MANTRYGALLAANQIRKRQKNQDPYGGANPHMAFKTEPLRKPRPKSTSGTATGRRGWGLRKEKKTYYNV